MFKVYTSKSVMLTSYIFAIMIVNCDAFKLLILDHNQVLFKLVGFLCVQCILIFWRYIESSLSSVSY